jgi:hypothetical protein
LESELRHEFPVTSGARRFAGILAVLLWRHVDAERIRPRGLAKTGHGVDEQGEKVGLGIDVELAIDALAVSADCFPGDIEALCSQVSAVAPQHEFQYVFFPR